MGNRTIPEPIEGDRIIARRWIDNNAVDAIAQLHTELRWLRNMLHPTPERPAEGREITVESLQAIMARDALTMQDMASTITQQRVKIDNLQHKLQKRKKHYLTFMKLTDN